MPSISDQVIYLDTNVLLEYGSEESVKRFIQENPVNKLVNEWHDIPLSETEARMASRIDLGIFHNNGKSKDYLMSLLTGSIYEIDLNSLDDLENPDPTRNKIHRICSSFDQYRKQILKE